VIGNHLASDVLQVEVRDVEPEPKSIGQHPGVEGAWGIDRLESRYVGVRLFAQFHAPLLGPPDRWAVGNRGRLRNPLSRLCGRVGTACSAELTPFCAER